MLPNMDKKTLEKIENSRNKVTNFNGFYISYHPFCNLPMEGDAHRKPDETALVKDGNFFILYGNYEKEMVEAAKKGGFKAAKKIFDDHPKEHSFWSN